MGGRIIEEKGEKIVERKGLGAALKLASLVLLLGAATPLAASTVVTTVNGTQVSFTMTGNAQLQVTVVAASPFTGIVFNNGLAGFGPSGLETATFNGAYAPGWSFIAYSPGVFGISNPYAPLNFSEHVQVSNTYVFTFGGSPFNSNSWTVNLFLEQMQNPAFTLDAPEPGTMWLALAAIAALVARRRLSR